jgi:hypothetical protein
VLPPHWAMCDLIIGPSHIIMPHQPLCHHSYSATSSSLWFHIIIHTIPCHCPYSATPLSIQCHVNIRKVPRQYPYNSTSTSILPHVTLPCQHLYCHVSPCHIGIRTSMCHLTTFHFRIMPHVTFFIGPNHP